MAAVHTIPTALAQIRAMSPSTIQNFFDPNTPPPLSPSSPSAISFGVMLEGRAKFFLETLDETTPISSNDVAYFADASGSIYLLYEGVRYSYATHPRLACPLAKMFARNGIVAYTVSSFLDASGKEAASNLGLFTITESDLPPSGEVFSLRGREYRLVNRMIAKEFRGNEYMPLIGALDFPDTEPLPNEFVERELLIINDGAERQAQDRYGYYFWSDRQIVYEVYLNEERRSVEVAGLPLQYERYFKLDGTQVITDLSILSGDVGIVNEVSRFDNNSSNSFNSVIVSQFDIIVAYQSAAIYRQFVLDAIRNGDVEAKKLIKDVFCKG